MRKKDETLTAPEGVPVPEEAIYLGTLDPPPNVRLSDAADYVAYWRTNGKEIAFPSDEDEARQGWYSEDARDLLATCPFVEPIEPVKS